MLKMCIQRSGKSQNQVQNEAHIPKNRMTELVNGRANPKPDEIARLDKALNQNRRLVYTYCSTVCMAGQYAGYQFHDIDAQKAGIRIISILTTLDKLIPDIAEMLCEERVAPEILAKLRQLRLSIMALEVHLSRDQLSCCDSSDLQEYRLRKKRATASTVAQRKSIHINSIRVCTKKSRRSYHAGSNKKAQRTS